MATLTNTKIKDTYDGLLKTTDNDVIGASEKNITDGLGNASVLSIGTASASFSSDIEVNTLTIGKGANDVSTNTALGYQTLENATGAGNTAVGYASLLDNTIGVNNTAVGLNSLRYNITGGDNTAIGVHSLTNNTASSNTAIGSYALNSNTTGGNNTAIGRGTLNSNTTGSNITAVGRGSMSNATAGDNNTALGFYSLVDNQASNNVAVGDLALRYNTTGSDNTAIGHGALDANTTGQKNVAVGSQALSTQTIGSFSTALGFEALMSQTTGSNNTAVGYASMRTNTTGIYNTAIGIGSLYDNTEGQNNTAVGHNSANSNTTGLYNTALGASALYANETSGNNTALGYRALRNSTEGNNTAVGSGALADNTTGGSNVAMGKDALNSNTTGGFSTALGADSMNANTTGGFNTAVGHNSLSSNTTGTRNTAVGKSALLLNIDGERNVALGYGAGTTKTGGDNNIYIGDEADGGSATTSNEIVIGSGATGNGSNTATYGNASITEHYFTSGTVRINSDSLQLVGATNPTILVQDSTSGVEVGLKALETSTKIDSTHTFNIEIGSGNDIIQSVTSSGVEITGNLAVDTNTLYVDAASNEVGVGTSNPDGKMHILNGSAGTVTANGNADELVVENSATGGISILTPDSSTGYLMFGSPTDNEGAIIRYNQSGGLLTIGTEIAGGQLTFRTAAGSERMRIDSSGNVGIGESSARNARLLLNNAGSQGAPQLMFVDSGDSGKQSEIRFDSGDLIFDYWSGASRSERMRIDSSGTTTMIKSSSGASTTPLVVRNPGSTVVNTESKIFLSTVSGDDRGAYISAKITDTSNGNALILATNTAGSSPTERMRIDSSGNVTVKAAGADQARTLSLQGTNGASETYQFNLVADGANAAAKFMIGVGGGAASERMRIDSSGNVGIGADPSSYKLRVREDQAADTIIRAENQSSSASAYSTLHLSSFGNTWGIRNGSSAANGNSLVFVNDAGGNNFERMRIDSSGNVGIGTSNAGAKIEINASGGGLGGFTSFKTKYGTSSVQSLSIGQVTAGNGAWIGMAQYRAGGFWQTEGTAAGLINFEADGVISFSTNSGLTANTDYNKTERMRITSGGDVLVGDSSFVADSLRIDQNGIISTSRTGTSTQVHHNFYNGNGLVGTISTSGSSTAYNTSSDYRLKENVVEMTGALDRVDALKPSRFNFIADPEKTVDGFLAHEVAEVVPEAVTGEKDAVDEEGNPIYQGIDQSKIVPLLVGAIKELRAEIETLKSQLNA